MPRGLQYCGRYGNLKVVKCPWIFSLLVDINHFQFFPRQTERAPRRIPFMMFMVIPSEPTPKIWSALVLKYNILD